MENSWKENTCVIFLDQHLGAARSNFLSKYAFHIFGVKAEKGKNWYRPTFGCKLLKQICSIFLHFLLFLHFCAKKVYFNQHLECAAPKYTFTTYITQEQLHIHSVPKTPRFSRVCLSVLDGLGGLTNSFKNSNTQQLS